MKVTLLPRKEFEIKTQSECIRGQFGTWTLNRFCIKKGKTLADAAEILSGELQFIDVVDFILCAIEYKCRLNKTDFDYSDVDVCNWIDEMGGMASPEFLGLVSHASSTDDDSKKKVKARQ